MKPVVLLIILGISFLTACSIAPGKNEWPTNIPPRSYFVAYYAQDIPHQAILKKEEYLTWVHRFYFGWELYGRGWLQATEELVNSLKNPKEKQYAKRIMLKVGALVAPEWAKNKKFRVINTRHISIWGNSLHDAIARKEQLTTLDKIHADVDGLLEKRLSPSDIDYDRYFKQEPFGNIENF